MINRSYKISSLLLGCSVLVSSPLWAASEKQQMDFCLAEQMEISDATKTLGEVRKYCEELLAEKSLVSSSDGDVLGDADLQVSKEILQQDGKAGNPPKTEDKKLTPFEKRRMREYINRDNPNVITSHKRNYMLPFTWVDDPNEAPYQALGQDISLDHFESKFQLSFKAPLAEKLWAKDDQLFFGFTLQSYWQVYNSEISAPFRETNYQPEVFYGIFNDYKIGEWTNRVNVIGLEHQSNGRSQPLSRSWNRLYLEFVWENDNWIVMFKPWYRLPEKAKSDPAEASGDDNPDIAKYMGYFDFSSVYKWDRQTFGFTLRNNLRSDNKGGLQLDWTFPMGKRFKGYAQFYTGYGESLIDYNHSVQRLGIGVLLTDIF